MKFHAAISDHESTDVAIASVVDDARQALGDGAIDAAFLFFTPHHAGEAQTLIDAIARDLDPETLLGCSAEGVIGVQSEIERTPGLVLLTARLPGVRIQPFHLAKSDWKPLLTDLGQLTDRLGAGPDTRCLIGLGDPFTTPLMQFLPRLAQACPTVPLVGGMASAAQAPGDNLLICNDSLHTEGFVGLSLAGPLEVQTVVSQGCRPIGHPLVVTKSQENVLFGLGGKRALDVLREIVNDMPEPDQQLLANGLLIGRAVSEYRDTFRRNDFVIRNIVGVSEEQGAIGAGDYLRTGQTVQFFVRDAQTAAEDLEEMLAPQTAATPAAGALLFSCNGRGTRLFDQPAHDASAAHRHMPATPLAGFFAAGELGPVGGQNFIHGHTASFALFRPLS